jgi:chemotaxis signal transduction protein
MNLGTRGALTFRLGDYSFAVRVEEAGGILDAERLAQLPGVCDPVAGVAAFRGEMVPVVDLASYLGIEARAPAGPRYALVLTRGPDRFALLIPEIPKLIPGRELREAPPDSSDSELGDLFESLLENDQDQFHCLNYWRIFETSFLPLALPAGDDMARGISSCQRKDFRETTRVQAVLCLAVWSRFRAICASLGGPGLRASWLIAVGAVAWVAFSPHRGERW